MASSFLFHSLPSISSCHRNPTIFAHSQFLPLNSLKLRKQYFLSNSRFVKLRARRSSSSPVVYAAQNNFSRGNEVVELLPKGSPLEHVKSLHEITVWKVGKDGIEAGTNLVPDSIPRPVARISVAIVALTVGLFLLKSVLSTAFFVLAMMGAIYFTFIALNKDEGPRGGGGSSSSSTSTDETLEEARRIMEKYK